MDLAVRRHGMLSLDAQVDKLPEPPRREDLTSQWASCATKLTNGQVRERADSAAMCCAQPAATVHAVPTPNCELLRATVTRLAMRSRRLVRARLARSTP